ncbi:unnamed protein product [Euphydryas editha]|uniref:Peptidase S1 domain-containing protein n=1 Tax=Euphydryas editha TaxID=104508 RepID=A0AAU9UVL9_EUPED|nr:unnamed protein product [Euphydryas editha]
MRALIILALGLAIATVGTSARRIVGGSVTSIETHPYAAALFLRPVGTTVFRYYCTGSIINNRSVLTSCACFLVYAGESMWRVNVGSTDISNGVAYRVNRIISHENFNLITYENDIAMIRIQGAFSFNNRVSAAPIAGPNYNLPDNAPVWIIGWGATSLQGPSSSQLRHVQVSVVNQSECRNRYAEVTNTTSVTNNMMCSGYLDIGGHGACGSDRGSPIIHNNVIVGVSSWRYQCGHPRYPDVNTLVSRYTSWILSNQ